VLQDQILWCEERGHSYERIIRMDFPSFRSLYESCVRLHAEEQKESTINMRLAAQDMGKGILEHLKALEKRMQYGHETETNDLNAFLKEAGSGF